MNVGALPELPPDVEALSDEDGQEGDWAIDEWDPCDLGVLGEQELEKEEFRSPVELFLSRAEDPKRGLGDFPSPEELGDGSPGAGWSCKCSKKCSEYLWKNWGRELEELRRAWVIRSKPEQDLYLWNLIRMCQPKPDSEDGHWKLGGKTVRERAWQLAVGVGTPRLGRLLASVRGGGLQPWEDQRKYNGRKESPQFWDADAFLNFIYQYVAEPLANAGGEREAQGRDTPRAILDWAMDQEGHNPLAGSTVGLEGKASGDPRYIAHMSKVELYELYRFHGTADQKDTKASQSTFLRVFKRRWRYLIRIREVAQHTRCDDCAKLTKIRREDPEARNREAANVAYRKHLQRMLADRALDHRLSLLSEYSTVKDATQHSRLLHIRIDGMDQAKFRCPRNLCDAKQWGALWRPTLHLVGCLVEGLLEIYFLTDQDVKKDSNMEMTCISRALDMAQRELLLRGLDMPEHLSLTWDNTAREGKNQHLAKYQAWLVSTGCFRSVQDGQGQVGHTHNKLDQRFSVVAAILKGCQVLQTPEDFLHAISQKVHPPGGRRLVVTKLDACYDWRPFFDPLAINVTGIAASVPNPDVCHCKRFILRADLDRLLPRGTEVDIPEVFARVPPDQSDVIMLSKEFWSSEQLSQAPLLFLPKVVAESLAPGGPRQRAERNHLSEEQLKQFRRTAAKVAEHPWNLVRAQQYLSQWCRENEQRVGSEPVKLKFVVDGKTQNRWEGRQLDASEQDEWLRYASGAPAPIKVVAGAKKRVGEPAPRGHKRPNTTPEGPGVGDPMGVLPPGNPEPTATKRANGLGGRGLGGISGAGGQTPAGVHPEEGGSPAGPVAEQGPALVLGCSKCRWQETGCAQCRRPNFRGRRRSQG